MATLPRWGDSFPRDALARIRDLEAALNSLTTTVAAAGFPITYHDGTYSYEIAAETGDLSLDSQLDSDGTVNGHVDVQVVSATVAEVVSQANVGSHHAGFSLLASTGTPNDGAYFNNGDGSAGFIVGAGDPNGAITADEGSLFVDNTTPALYQNTDGADTWVAVGGGGATFPIAYNDGTYTYTAKIQFGATSLQTIRNSDSHRMSDAFVANDGVSALDADVSWNVNVNNGDAFLYVGSDGSTFSEATLNVNTNSSAAVAGVSGFAWSAPSFYVDAQQNLWFNQNSAPANGDLDLSSFSIWLDDTPGATKIMFKAKDSGGTVRTGSVSLT